MEVEVSLGYLTPCSNKPCDYSPSMWGKAQSTVTGMVDSISRAADFTAVVFHALHADRLRLQQLSPESRSALFLSCRRISIGS